VVHFSDLFTLTLLEAKPITGLTFGAAVLPLKKTMPKEQDDILNALADINEAVGKRFDRLDEQFTEHRGRFDTVDHQLLEIRGQLERIEEIILKDHAKRIEILERKLGIGA